ncbi:MAG: FHA domain-containing protein [Phycisphaera sp.]|nr:FHA domain-containing protein [Phycisphaera sp.]
MESMIRVQMMQGPQAGYQVTLTDPTISFGRAPENHISLDEAHLSRHHGDLQFHDGHWYLVCHSSNGCTVNGKKVKTGQSRPLNPGDVVGIGKHKIFAVNFTPTPGAAEVAAPVVQDTGPKMSGRSKLWVSIAIYIGVVMVIGIVLAAVGKPKKAAAQSAPQLTNQQISAEVRRPFKRTENEREAESHLSEARTWYARIEARSEGLFLSHYHYKLALAFARKDSFDGIDQLHFAEVEQKLIEQITTKYTNAYSMLRSQQWYEARAAFQELLQIYQYSGNDSVIKQNITAQLKIIEPHTKRKSFG